MNCLSRHAKLSTQSADAWASNCACVMRVMAARARVPVFEKAHALMKYIHMTCNGKYMDNC